MSNDYNYVNIGDLPEIPEVAPGDYFVVKTPAGQALIDYANLPFTSISGNNITILGPLSSDSVTVLTTLTSSTAFLDKIFIQGLTGLDISGNYNTFEIRSGIVISAYNTTSDYVLSLSASTDALFNNVSASTPKIFTDTGLILIDGTPSAPSYSEVVIGNNDVPENLFISPNDINIQYLFNSDLNTFLQSNSLSSLPLIFVEENVSNSYINSNNKIQFRAIFRPPLKSNARLAWNVTRIY
jgi:hypothetical protein